MTKLTILLSFGAKTFFSPVFVFRSFYLVLPDAGYYIDLGVASRVKIILVFVVLSLSRYFGLYSYNVRPPNSNILSAKSF